jgi:putative addiction module antidote
VFKAQVTTVGDGIGIALPKEVMARLKVADGDLIILTECPGGFQITRYDPEFERQMVLAREVMREQRNVLEELAKGSPEAANDLEN